jgi:Meiotically Up-regulated Gene 113 (MUG113) protein
VIQNSPFWLSYAKFLFGHCAVLGYVIPDRNTLRNTEDVMTAQLPGTEYCTVTKASVMLNISDGHVLALVSARQLQAYGKGALLRISVDSVRAFKDANPGGVDCQPRGYIYVIYWHGYYKIGQAVRPDQRVKDIGNMHPVKPTLVHLIPTDSMNRLEQHLHKWFAGKRVSGEWFNLSNEDIQRIKAVKSYLMDYKTRRFPKLPD